MFQSLFAPRKAGGSAPALNNFHKVVKFKEAPSAP